MTLKFHFDGFVKTLKIARGALIFQHAERASGRPLPFFRRVLSRSGSRRSYFNAMTLTQLARKNHSTPRTSFGVSVPPDDRGSLPSSSGRHAALVLRAQSSGCKRKKGRSRSGLFSRDKNQRLSGVGARGQSLDPCCQTRNLAARRLFMNDALLGRAD
jgi:hypothetical protein